VICGFILLRYDPHDVEARRIWHYRILRRLGAGGMGEVYAAEDERLRREVAIKFIRSSKAADESARHRFEREAQAASLNHPHICTIFEISEYEGQPFLVMELLEGQDLRRLCAAGPIEIAALVKLGVKIADALDTAHKRGITHRDIKPAYRCDAICTREETFRQRRSGSRSYVVTRGCGN